MSNDRTLPTFTATIWVGLRVGYGERVHDVLAVHDVCRDYVNEVGWCVTVTETTFLYRTGGEPGASVGVIAYPRFPLDEQTLRTRTLELAERLRVELEQRRLTVVFPDVTMLLGEVDDVEQE